MRLEKSSFGYKLISSDGTKQDINNAETEMPQNCQDYLGGLVKRLRNLFLSVVPVDYCCIMLYGADDQLDPCEADSQQQEIEMRQLEYLGQALGVIRYRVLENISDDDRAKIEMLADLYGYLIYHHLLMFEFLNTD